MEKAFTDPQPGQLNVTDSSGKDYKAATKSLLSNLVQEQIMNRQINPADRINPCRFGSPDFHYEFCVSMLRMHKLKSKLGNLRKKLLLNADATIEGNYQYRIQLTFDSKWAHAYFHINYIALVTV